MTGLTNWQQETLEALCRTIVPAAFDDPSLGDLTAHVASRMAELPPFPRRRALLALNLFAAKWLSALLIGSATSFSQLDSAARERLLRRCASHRLPALRLLFNSVRRLILNAHYARPGALVMPAVPTARAVVRERVLPAGVIEHPEQQVIKTRVCIIGSGVGGATAAAIIAQAGHDVVVIEKGGYYTGADFGTDETQALRTLYADSGLRTTDQLNVAMLQGQCAGGGSTVNWMVMLRTPSWVLDEWQWQHGTDGMDRIAMARVFDQFEQLHHVAPVPDDAHSRVNRLLLDGAASLGWSARSAAINARDCMRVGTCGMGCRYDAKKGALLIDLPSALRAGARLYCNTQVERITRVAGSYRIHADKLEIAADIVIVAAGAVETPALLQRSGLGTRAVGQHLRLHPTTAMVGLYDEPVNASVGIPLSTYCDEFMQRDDGYGHWIETPPLSAGLAALALPGFGQQHRDYMQRFPYLAPLIVLVRDRDSVGYVRERAGETRISYRLGQRDRANLLHGMESAARIHFAAGARAVLTLHAQETLMHSPADIGLIHQAAKRYGDPALFSAHVNGTCRIGRHGNTSGCRPDGRLHDERGVYVMDGSLLPTAPGVNPHETIAAVTQVLATRLVNEWSSLRS